MARDACFVLLSVLEKRVTGLALARLAANRVCTNFLSRWSRDEEMPYTSAASSIVGYGLTSFTGLLMLRSG